MQKKFPRYFRYWGKADQHEGGVYHLLPYHCLDVAAVGWHLLSPEKALCGRLSEMLGVESDWFRDFFVFCLALHDLGKFARAFQGLKPGLSPLLVTANSSMRYAERHDTLGFLLWKGRLDSQVESSLSENRRWIKSISPWLEIVTGHHGVPPKKSGVWIPYFFEREDEEAALHFALDVYSLFLSEFNGSELLEKQMKRKLKPISWQLAGVTVLADWLGSNQDFFRFQMEPEELSLYWHNRALPSAQEAIQCLPSAPRASRFKGLTTLFPFIKQPTPLQNYAVDVPITDTPQIFILEDVTGAGKTEAALVLIHRLLNAGVAEGLYLALPTMATANAMYQRMEKVYRLLYEQTHMPSLVLAHGARHLSEAFRKSVMVPESPSSEMNYKVDENETELAATAYCNAWLADSRKKSLLADVGVGTLDQALLAVLPARHQSLRLLGLNRKVLLVDEVHAYDSYMQKLLDALLEIHARQGGSVIMLSATLPQTMREKLIAAFHHGLDRSAPKISCNAYPLATHSSVRNTSEAHINTREDVKRTIRIRHITAEDAVMAQIRKAVEEGQCVCWIRNTVKAALETYRSLEEAGWLDSRQLHLFHGRFAMVDRQRIELNAVERFGEESDENCRSGHVLIATQVVEQSLDLDFDVLITDLAPIDLLIQRAGREKRHIRDRKGNRLREPGARDERGTPVLYLFAPEFHENPKEDWLKTHQKGTQAVYPHVGQLWLTLKCLMNDFEGEFSMPNDARALIEGVYSEAALERIPAALKKASLKAAGEDQSKKSMADLNVLKLSKGYTRSSGDWDEEIRIPTRLSEEESVSVALARMEDGRLIPYAETDHHQWPMSVVKVPERQWKKVRQEIPDSMRPLIEELKTEEKAIYWMDIFPLTEDTAPYYSRDYGWHSEGGG
ncbi:CRISPR-associated helicase Cas3 [delta proteobacterium NaphS2]|nr:CRISPR-associated helicase Cas3 [delta proteobacterium NaphS2]